MRRYPRTRTTEKFRKFGDVYNADVWLNKLPNPTIETKLSLVMVFAGGWRDVIAEKVLCVINVESEEKFENFSTFIKRIVIETMTPSSSPSQEYALQPALTIFCAAFFLQLLLECINYLFVRRKKEFKLNRVKLETTLMEIEKVQRERKLLEENASYSSEGKELEEKTTGKEEEKLGPRFSHAHAKSERDENETRTVNRDGEYFVPENVKCEIQRRGRLDVTIRSAGDGEKPRPPRRGRGRFHANGMYRILLSERDDRSRDRSKVLRVENRRERWRKRRGRRVKGEPKRS